MDMLEDRIEDYTSYFKSVLEGIASMAAPQERATPVFRTILYFSCLDAWAGDAFPRQRNKDRFVRFLHEIAKWEHADRVCIPQFFEYMSSSQDDNHLILKQISMDFKYGVLHYDILYESNVEIICENIHDTRFISDDPKIDVFLSTIGAESKARVESFQFSHLLWDYRNSMVHRFEFPGRAIDMPSRKQDAPYYVHCDNKLELVLPVAFLQKLCHHSLAKFDRWLRERNFDPYHGSELRTSWKRDG